MIGEDAQGSAPEGADDDNGVTPAALEVRFNRKWTVSAFQFSGKRRKDAVKVHSDTELCTIFETCGDGEAKRKHVVKCGMKVSPAHHRITSRVCSSSDAPNLRASSSSSMRAC